MISIAKIGKNVKKYRRNSKLTQEQLAERVNISTVHMSHVESGSVTMSLDLTLRICDELCITPNHLLLDDGMIHQDPHLLDEKISSLTSSEREFLISFLELLIDSKINRGKF